MPYEPVKEDGPQDLRVYHDGRAGRAIRPQARRKEVLHAEADKSQDYQQAPGDQVRGPYHSGYDKRADACYDKHDPAEIVDAEERMRPGPNPVNGRKRDLINYFQ